MTRQLLPYFEFIFRENWEEDIDGRIESVPQPRIQIANTLESTRVSTIDYDVIFIRDGGPQSITPKSAGWMEEEIEDLTSIDIRTNHSHARLRGVRDPDTNEAERYGGLRGEVKRILDLHRKGDQEYDLINGFEWNDLSGDVGFQHYRGVFDVRLTQVASTIEPVAYPDGVGT